VQIGPCRFLPTLATSYSPKPWHPAKPKCRHSLRLDTARSRPSKNAHRLSKNEGIKARIAELRAQNAEKYQMSREETLAWLTRVIRTGAGSITPEKELCQSYSVGKHGSRITMPDMGDF
jgi:hypothetical protein